MGRTPSGRAPAEAPQVGGPEPIAVTRLPLCQRRELYTGPAATRGRLGSGRARKPGRQLRPRAPRPSRAAYPSLAAGGRRVGAGRARPARWKSSPQVGAAGQQAEGPSPLPATVGGAPTAAAGPAAAAPGRPGPLQPEQAGGKGKRSGEC